MIWENILFNAVYTLVLVFGILMTIFFSGIQLNRKNLLLSLIPVVFCSTLQIIAHNFLHADTVWTLYPLMVHLPTFLMLTLYWKRRVLTSIAAITTAYLCCHPPKWIALAVEIITEDKITSQMAHLILMVVLGVVSIKYFAPHISQLFNRSPLNVAVFSVVPVAFYWFDYLTSAWPAFWEEYAQLTSDFLPFILCIGYFMFLMFYQQMQEHAENAERTQQMLRFQYEQREKEYAAIKQREYEIHLMRHDMRLHLNNLALCLENKDVQSAQNIVSGLTSTLDRQKIKHYTEHTIINYILSDFEEKAKEKEVRFDVSVNLPHIELDEMRFSAILSNAIENALNAQDDVPQVNRYVRILLKYSNGKLLFSVSNPFVKAPVFSDGLPINNAPGHGYGTQSIRYLTEYLGGKCHFSAKNGVFHVRVII